MITFFTADQHFYHTNIIRYCNRPFADVSDMNTAIRDRWNSVVSCRDTVYVLGDVLYKCCDVDACKKLIGSLNGNIHVILGSHDKESQLRQVGLRQLYPNRLIKIDGIWVYLNHCAMRVWERSHYGAFHLYGHSHGRLPENSTWSFDVGVDCWNFYPVSFEQVCEKMRAKGWKAEYNDTFIGDPMC